MEEGGEGDLVRGDSEASTMVAEESQVRARSDSEVEALQAEAAAAKLGFEAAESGEFREGDAVEVFYRTMEEGNGGYFPTMSASDCLRSPRVARTDCWVPAVVVRPHQGWRGEMVVVRHAHPFWRDSLGNRLDMGDESNSVQRFAPERVRRVEGGDRGKRRRHARASLCLALVRWGGEDAPESCSGTHAGGWGPSGAVPSALYCAQLLDAIHARLGTNYEAVTCYVASGDDLRRLCERRVLGLVSGSAHYGALYLLWPTQFDDGTAGRPGMVPAPPFFDLVQRLEGCGVPSRFPHAAHVYKTLVSKEWTTTLGALPTPLHVPPTTRVDLAMVERDPAAAARRAIAALQKIGGHFKARRAGAAQPWTKGVAKLGYSWEAIDVRLWEGPDDLERALVALARQPGCAADYVFVQEFVDAVGEMRAYCVDGTLKKLLYTRFDEPNAEKNTANADAEKRDDDDDEATKDDAGRFTTFSELDRADAVHQWFRGDAALADAAEHEVRSLVKKWLNWLRGLNAEPLPFVRIDVFVCVHDAPDGGPPRLSVATGELTELGASFLGWHEGPKLVFDALLRSCFRDRPRASHGCVCSTVADDGAKKAKHRGKKKRKANGADAAPTPPASPPQPQTAAMDA